MFHLTKNTITNVYLRIQLRKPDVVLLAGKITQYMHDSMVVLTKTLSWSVVSSGISYQKAFKVDMALETVLG